MPVLKYQLDTMIDNILTIPTEDCNKGAYATLNLGTLTTPSLLTITLPSIGEVAIAASPKGLYVVYSDFEIPYLPSQYQNRIPDPQKQQAGFGRMLAAIIAAFEWARDFDPRYPIINPLDIENIDVVWSVRARSPIISVSLNGLVIHD